MLVLSHHEPIPDGIRQIAEALGIAVHECADPQEARRVFGSAAPRIVLLPAFLNHTPMLPFMRECLEREPGIQTIMVVERHQINEAAEAMQAGVLDCLFRPFSRERLAKTLAAAMRRLGQPVPELDRALTGQAASGASIPARKDAARADGQPGDACLRGSHPATLALRQAVAEAATHTLPVLLWGEPGSGKSQCARLIHARPDPVVGGAGKDGAGKDGAGKDGAGEATAPLREIDCSTLEAEEFARMLAAASPGTTFFLDELADLNAQVQARLVRLIGEEGPGAARLISASSHDPEALTGSGRLRRDLFYRLCVCEIRVPPLRARIADLPAIATGLLAEIAAGGESGPRRFSAQAQEVLMASPWPGNLRQLSNLVRALVLRHGATDIREITPGMLPPQPRGPMAGPASFAAPAGPAEPADLARLFDGLSLDQIERRVIEAIIAQHGNSVTRAARVLGVAPSTLYRKREAWARRDREGQD